MMTHSLVFLRRALSHRNLVLAPLVSLCLAAAATAQTVSLAQTDGNQGRLLATSSISFGTTNTSGYVTVIAPSTSYQSMDGFGASLTDSSA